ncbi:MAG TPA: hypothetical protein PK014_13200 [Thermoanaerobaculia bacterium]|nr:hypothetical protein [Thermoanaerobaculia bacterium]HUM31057.1 hypothetical protein [Thermoanaerobaculia bacterium]HXK69355.1 hypothetical protein [Thermoanaerobaculia bacterium]
MTHSTLADLLDHIMNGTELRCSCDRCRSSLEALRAEQMRPREEAAFLPERFPVLEGRRESRLRIWVPALAAAMVLIAALFILIRPGVPSDPHRMAAALSEQEQEELLTQIDTALSEPALGDLEVLVDTALDPELQSYDDTAHPSGGTHEA